MTLQEKMKNILDNFDLQQAKDVCDEAHALEVSGYDLSPQEEWLWKRLTVEIEIEKVRAK